MKTDIKNINSIDEILGVNQIDPEAQIHGSGVKWNNESSDLSDNVNNNSSYEKFRLMLNELSNVDSYPILFENSKSNYSEFDSNIAQICNIIAETSNRVSEGKEISALRTRIGYGVYTCSKPRQIGNRQVVSELDSIDKGIETMIPWLTFRKPDKPQYKRNIAYIGTGNLKLHQQISNEIGKYLEPNYWSVTIKENKDSETSKYFLLGSLSPSELCKTMGLKFNDEKVQLFLKSLNKKNESISNG
tara:strand:+ start:3209 stop:3943 length:735 start_codon:yes stop_codon:yes gene_type:complete